jgi:gamma-glutamyltranspeptidase/glutathione hydrolase
MSTRSGVVAAGHPRTAEAGAAALRAGGNAVDAAVAAVLASFSTEPLLTGLGAGGHMLVALPGEEPVLLDFFVEMPGRGLDPADRGALVPVEVSFGDAVQVFHIGPASVGTWGSPAGLCEASARYGRLELAELCEPAARLAADGVALNAQQAYVVEILGAIVTATPEARAIFAPRGRLLGAGDVLRNPELARALRLLGERGAAPFATGEVAAAALARLAGTGALVGEADLAAYRVVARAPVRVAYRGREVLTNPPPSAGGILIAHALGRLEEEAGPPDLPALVAAMEDAQARRTPAFLEGLDEPGFLDRFLAARMGSTTHVSAIDADGGACAVTSSLGEGSGIVVPGFGVHLNNMLGEADLNPLGFHAHPPGRRLPSMMAPTVVLRDGQPELVLGSGGSNRIRSALLQVIANVVDRGMGPDEAVRAPRAHVEDGIVFVEPGLDTSDLQAEGRALTRFRAPNLFFGGVQAAYRDPATGALSGAGDPRRGGAVATA